MRTASTKWRMAFETDGVTPILIAVLKLDGIGASFFDGGSFIEGTNQFTFVNSFRTDGTLIPRATSPVGTDVLKLSDRPFFPNTSIARIAPSSQNLDPKTRTVSTGETSIHFLRDGAFQDLIGRSKFLKGRPVQVYLGTPTMALDDCLLIGQWLVWDLRITPDGMAELLLQEPKSKNEITSIAVSVWATHPNIAVAYNLGGNFVSFHPLDLVATLLGLSDVTAGMIDPSITDTSRRSGFGQLCLTRYIFGSNIPDNSRLFNSPDGGMSTDENVRDVINAIETILNGVLRVSSTGLYSFLPFDQSRAPDAIWDSPNDIISAELIESWKDQVNQGLFEWAEAIATCGLEAAPYAVSAPTFLFRDQNSQNRYSGDFSTRGIYEAKFRSSWVNGIGMIIPGEFSGGTSAGATMYGVDCALNGFSGCRFDPVYDGTPVGGGASLSAPPVLTDFVIPTWAQCSDAQPVYVRITGYNTSSHSTEQEIVRVNAIAPFSPTDYDFVFERDAPVDGSGTILFRAFPRRVQMTIAERGLFGTTAIDWGGPHFDCTIEDLTVPILYFTSLFQRGNDGLTRVRLTTPIRMARTEVGDFIAFKDQRISVLGHSSVDTDLKWEVLRAEVDVQQARCVFEVGLINGINSSLASLDLRASQNFWYRKTS